MTSNAQGKARTGSRTPKVLAALLLTLLTISCAQDKARTSSRTPKVAPADPWIITNLDPEVKTPSLLWNGLVGARISPLRSVSAPWFDIAAYQGSGEEKILALPSPLSLHIDSRGSDFHPEASTDFKEVLDLRSGQILQSWRDRIRDWQVEVRTVIHPTRRLLAQRWILKPKEDSNIRIRSYAPSGSLKVISSGQTARDMELQADPVRFQIRDTTSISQVGAWTAGPLPTWQGDVAAGKELIFDRVVSTEREPIDPGLNFGAIARASEEGLKRAWETDIEIDGPVEDQQFVRSALFYLRGSVHPQGKMSVSPMGLSSDIYSGHVFWDADVWVFPALALIDPERAKAIPRYRLNHLSQAVANFEQWVDAGMPTGNGKFLSKPNPSGSRLKWIDGAKYPWESSVSGRETVPGPSKFQDQITGSVAWSVNQASALGLVDQTRNDGLRRLAAQFLATRSTPPRPFQLLDTMSPDENHTGDNDLYTNLLAMWCTSGGNWPTVPTYKLPTDSGQPPNAQHPTPNTDPPTPNTQHPTPNALFLTYDNDALRGYKQAAAVLSIYPLQYPPAEKRAREMMDRFADKVSKNGPAMSDSIHALIWARLGERDKAYEAWHNSWKPFVKPPFLLFSEKRNSSRTYFTTGAAGSLQAVLYGFAGLRIDDKAAPGAKWSMPLRGGKVLSIKPNLPAAWKKLTLRNLSVLGKRLTFEIEGDQVKVTTER